MSPPPLITLNGETVPLADATTIADLVRGHATAGTAVAVNGAVVPRSRHDEHRLADGDVVDLVTAVQGG